MTRPAPGSVQVWAISTLEPYPEHTLRALLTPAECQRADRYRQSEDRRRSIVARAILRLLLGRCLDLPPEDVVIDSDASGKPFLRAADPVQFSVSHSGEWVLIALSAAAEVGVDVEQIRPLDDVDQIAARFFAPAEARALAALPATERTGAFFRCWTRKEALLKALGTGLRTPLRSFAVSVSADQPPALLSAGDLAIGAGPWTLVDAPPAPGYAAAVAVRHAAASVQVHYWPPQGLSER